MGASQCFAIDHCVRDLRSITPPPRGVSSRTPRTLSAALGDDFRDVRGVGFGPLVLRTLGHDFRRTGNALSAPDALFASFVPVNRSRDELLANAVVA
jgi:hypothetical protein